MGKTVADLLLEILAAYGVRHVFGVIGDAIFPLADALSRQNRIQYVPAAMENGAAFMAAYTAKLTGTLGVCAGTSGPGAANLINGTAEAFLDQAPLLCLTGQVPSNRLGTKTKQYFRQDQLFAAITGQSRLCIHPAAFVPVLQELIQTALEERTAVHLEIPKDILAMPIEATFVLPVILSSPSDGNGWLSGNLPQLTEILSGSNNPLVVLGQEAYQVAEPLRQWAEGWGAGIVLTQEAKGLLPDCDPLVIGGVGPAFLPECWNNCDLILLFGTAVYEESFFPAGATIWQFDNAVRHPFSIHPQIRGDFQMIIAKLRALSPHRTERPAWRAQINAAHHARESAVAQLPVDNAGGIHPGALCKLLAEITNPAALVTLDVGEFGHWFNFSFLATRQIILHSTYWRSMGNGIPAGIAACCRAQEGQAPERQVISLVGDGGLLMSLPELSVVARDRWPMVIIVFRNQIYGLEEQKMKKEGFAVFGTTLALPDLVKLAESFGIKGYRLADLKGGASILQKALAEPPALVEVPVSSPALPFL